ncbi:MAG: hypothetical protein ACP5E5_01035 [Acidobacteriaceae bacterium]
MQLTLTSAFVGNAHVIRCCGALILGDESAALESPFRERSLPTPASSSRSPRYIDWTALGLD